MIIYICLFINNNSLKFILTFDKIEFLNLNIFVEKGRIKEQNKNTLISTIILIVISESKTHITKHKTDF